jgi:hypothetical protein
MSDLKILTYCSDFERRGKFFCTLIGLYGFLAIVGESCSRIGCRISCMVVAIDGYYGMTVGAKL